MNSRNGFSLIKILIIIAISGVLLAIAFYFVSTNQVKNRDAKRKTDLASLEKALSLSKAKSLNDTYYPSAITEATLVKQGLIEKIPTDPKNEPPYVYTYRGSPAGCTSRCTGYTLTACLENKNDKGENTTEPIPPCETRSYQVTHP